MKDTDIRKYAELMKELNLTGLEISDDNVKVRLERTLAAEHVERVITAADHASAMENAADADGVTIKSPIVGVFYAAPAENAEPFVSVGQKVEKGKTLCIIEAMKLMNEICAEESGIVEEVCVQNGQIVEFGTELFRIRR